MLRSKVLQRYNCFNVRSCFMATTQQPSTIKQTKESQKDSIGVLMELLKIPRRVDVHKYFQTHKFLCDYDPIELRQTINLLHSYGYENKEIIDKPSVLALHEMTLKNYHTVYRELGCRNVDVANLSRFLLIMNKKIKILKNHNFIPVDTNVCERLSNILSINIEPKIIEKHSLNDDDIPIKFMRRFILNEFFKKYFNFNDNNAEQLDKIWKTYPRIKNRSYQSILRTLEIYKNQLNFPNELILSNGFLLHCDPDNLEKILELKKLAGADIKELLLRRPKLAMGNYLTIKTNEKYFMEFGVSNEAMIKCLDVFTLGTDSIRSRLSSLKKTKELEVLMNNPRAVRLVHYHTKAQARLDYLKDHKVKCASLHILSCCSEAFSRYAQDGSDRTKGCDLVNLLSCELNETETELRQTLSRHANWCHIPVFTVKATLMYLRNNKFDKIDILQNVHILLYPIEKIKDQLKFIKSSNSENNTKFQTDENLKKLTKSQKLSLCVYLIEVEFHFTGDGIWPNQPQSNQLLNNSELLNNSNSIQQPQFVAEMPLVESVKNNNNNRMIQL